jgi:long-chain acyl-CoA synthetase
MTGVKPYDKIGIISNNRYEWAMIATAAYSLNASLVPMYEAQMSSDWRYIITDSIATVVFCSTKNIFDRVNKEVLPMTPHVHAALCLDALDGETYGYQTIAKDIRLLSKNDFSSVVKTPPTPEDLANLIYTSGTVSSFVMSSNTVCIYVCLSTFADIPFYFLSANFIDWESKGS